MTTPTTTTEESRPESTDRPFWNAIPAAWRTTPVLIAAGVALALAVGLIFAMTRPASGTPAEQPQDAVVQNVPEQDTATVGQYAGLIAGPINDFRDTVENYQENECVWDDYRDDLICTLVTMTLSINADLIVLVLTGAQDPKSGTYIGPPPAEIAALVDRTIEDAQALKDTHDEDGGLSKATWLAMSSLDSTLDRWAPYL